MGTQKSRRKKENMNNEDMNIATTFDLTNTVSKFLDRHLVFPLLEFLQNKKIYPEEDILKAKIALLSKTNMVDFEKDIYQSLHKDEELPVEYETRRKNVIKNLKSVQDSSKPIMDLLEDKELCAKLRKENNFNQDYLAEAHNITNEQIDALFSYAKFQYNCGNYSGAVSYLANYIPLIAGSYNENKEQYFSALWGKLGGNILLEKWDNALNDLHELKDAIDSGDYGTSLEQLQQRTWLIHWALFIFFNHQNGRTGIIDLFFQERYLNTIQTNCPHILRYLATASITNKKRKTVVKDLIKVLQQAQNQYKDPITEFLECLYIHFDFDGAQQKLRECEEVLENDFFLVACKDEFIENARLSVFEIYCRIHNCIDIAMLAEKLNMDQEQAERWIVNLIRNARLDAKIDSEKSYVVMRSQHPSVYQQIIDKTKNLQSRTQYINANLKQVL